MLHLLQCLRTCIYIWAVDWMHPRAHTTPTCCSTPFRARQQHRTHGCCMFRCVALLCTVVPYWDKIMRTLVLLPHCVSACNAYVSYSPGCGCSVLCKNVMLLASPSACACNMGCHVGCCMLLLLQHCVLGALHLQHAHVRIYHDGLMAKV